MDAVPLTTVLARPDVWRGDRFADAALPAVASGFAALDRELPGGGWPRGALTELLCDGAGQGELSLLLPAFKQLCADDGWLVLIAPPHPLHAGALVAAGIPLERLLCVAKPRNDKQAELNMLWAAEQALNSDAPAAVLCWSTQADSKSVRRLQVAAAASHAAAFLLRPTRALREASSAVLRLRLQTEHGGLAIDILKRRGPPLSTPLHLVLPRPAAWRSHHTAVYTHGTPLARPASAATVTRHPSGLAAG